MIHIVRFQRQQQQQQHIQILQQFITMTIIIILILNKLLLFFLLIYKFSLFFIFLNIRLLLLVSLFLSLKFIPEHTHTHTRGMKKNDVFKCQVKRDKLIWNLWKRKCCRFFCFFIIENGYGTSMDDDDDSNWLTLRAPFFLSLYLSKSFHNNLKNLIVAITGSLNGFKKMFITNTNSVCVYLGYYLRFIIIMNE